MPALDVDNDRECATREARGHGRAGTSPYQYVSP
jgi:hypothetical protein